MEIKKHLEHKELAMFAGAELKPIDDQAIRNSVLFNGKWYRDFGNIPFDTDWNLLMIVVDQINREGMNLFGLINWQFDITAKRVMISNGDHKTLKHVEMVRLLNEIQPLIQAVYNCVLEYLKFRQQDMLKHPEDYITIDK